MLRKTILAIAAAATLGAAALAPTSASAWWGHPGWHGWYHGWAYRPRYSCLRRPGLRRLLRAALDRHPVRTRAALG
jgi:hypothetical protein